MKVELETIIMELVVNGGNARNLALEAISASSRRDFVEAEKRMKDCDDAIRKAHTFQTELISAEAGGEGKSEVSLLLVHGQDHLMNAMTVRDLAKQMIEMYRIMYEEVRR